MWHLLQKVTSYFTIVGKDLTPEAEGFLSGWQRRHSQLMLRSMTRFAAIISVLCATITYLLAPDPPRSINMIVFLTVGLVSFFWHHAASKTSFDGRYVQLAMQIIFALGTAISSAVTLSKRGTATDIAVVTAIMSSTSVFNIVIYPWWNAGVLLLGVGQLVLIAAAFSNHPSIEIFDLLITVGAGIIFGWLVYFDRSRLLSREALAEYESKKLLIQNEELKRIALEKDLLIAKEIQDSFECPKSLYHGPFQLSFFQKKSQILGGDWMAVRRLQNGDLVFVLVDATGKGVQAALVVHAVQSLWAQSLSNPGFDPIAWLNSVNRTLLALGQKTPQTVTMGLVVLGKQSLVYYAAGHPPLFLLKQEKNGLSTKTVMGRGDILGLVEPIRVEPRQVDLEIEKPDVILMGTDGILPRGGLTRGKDLESIVKKVCDGGNSGLSSLTAGDDMILILAQRVA